MLAHGRGEEAGIFLDIMPDRRIIYAYEMSFNDQRLSASLATVEFVLNGTQTRMLFTEQAAFLGGVNARRERVAGTEAGFDRLVATIASNIGAAH